MEEKINDLKTELSRKAPDEDSQTAPQPVTNSTPDLRQSPREPTESPEETATKKPGEKRPRAFTKEEE